mgnify:CR=1 FL=1
MEKIKHSNINFLNKVLKIIPLGSQTFSRSKIFFDERYSPLFNIKGNNGYIYDLNKKKIFRFDKWFRCSNPWL